MKLLHVRPRSALENSFRLAFWRFYFGDKGHIYHSHPITASSEHDQRATVGRKVRKVSRRNLARPAIGEAHCKRSKWRGLEVFCDEFFGHRNFFSSEADDSIVGTHASYFSSRSANLSRDVRCIDSV